MSPGIKGVLGVWAVLGAIGLLAGAIAGVITGAQLLLGDTLGITAVLALGISVLGYIVGWLEA